jgi:Ras-related protein Rab-5C
MDDVWMSEWMV